MELQGNAAPRELSFEVADERGISHEDLDDDGRVKRTGTLLTASAHIITAVIGSGVLSLAWAMAQLGWVIGLIVLLSFSFITWYCSTLQADCYRSPDPADGKRNYTYIEAVRANLGGAHVQLCGLVQYANLVGVAVSYAITTAISMAAVKRSYCFHRNGHSAPCDEPLNVYMLIFVVIEVALSQIPNFHKIWWLSIVAAAMSFSYSLIGLGLSIAKAAEGNAATTSLTGVSIGGELSRSEKIWRMLQSLGNVASAFSFSLVLIEIQDTLKASPPENQVMKRASLIGLLTTTAFYVLCGVVGYVAFGNAAPGNFLTGFGFYDPFWLIDIGNLCIVVHLLGAYQVFCQPVFQFAETWSHKRWPGRRGFLASDCVVAVPVLGTCSFGLWRGVWRGMYVVVTAAVAMTFPFFNSFLGFVGGVSFWPLTVYFPVEMYISQAGVRRFSGMWVWLKAMSLACFAVSVAAACGSLQGLVHDLGGYRPFKKH